MLEVATLTIQAELGAVVPAVAATGGVPTADMINVPAPPTQEQQAQEMLDKENVRVVSSLGSMEGNGQPGGLCRATLAGVASPVQSSVPASVELGLAMGACEQPPAALLQVAGPHGASFGEALQ